jgi:hypothetical protein
LRRSKARRPATESVNRPTRVSKAGKLKSCEATPFKYTFQAITVTAGQRVIGHVMPCGRVGFRAYDADDHPIGADPTMKTAADAVSKAAADELSARAAS